MTTTDHTSRDPFDLGQYVNDSNIGANDSPHAVIEKLQGTINTRRKDTRVQPQSREPVAWMDVNHISFVGAALRKTAHSDFSSYHCVPLYTTPPDAAAQIAALTKQRDELLNVITKAAAHVRPTCSQLYDELIAAIAQVKEQS